MIRILVVDDHPIIRKGLIQILSAVKGKYIMDEADDGYSAIEKIRKEKYDLILLDIAMPGLSGLDVLKQIRCENIIIPVLILSIYSEEQYAIRVLKAGASGYLTKQSAPEELLSAITRVINGGKYVSSSLAEMLAEEIEKKNKYPLYKSLSDREYQIMIMITSGKSNKMIANELCINIKTVSTYKTRIFKKLNVRNYFQLSDYVTQQKLLNL